MSLGVWGWYLYERRRGRPLFPEWRSKSSRFSTGASLIAFALGVFVLPAVLMEWLGKNFDDPVWMSQVVTLFRMAFVVIWGSAWWFLRGERARVGEEKRGHWLESLQMGGKGFLFALWPVWLLLLSVAHLRQPHPLIQLLKGQDSMALWGWVIAAAVIAAPLFEELMFRATLQPVLIDAMKPAEGIGITSAIFALSHGFPDAIPLYPLALVLGYLHFRTRSFLAVVTMHALFNAYNLLLFWLSEAAGA